MAFEFKLPDLGEGIEEAQVLVWKVRPGQEVAAFEPLCDVESAKAAVELTSPVGGRVREMRVAEGETAQRGEVLVVIDTSPASVSAAPAPDEGEWFGIVGTPPRRAAAAAESGSAPTGKILAAPFVRRLAKDLGVHLEDVHGSGPQGRIRAADVQAASQRRQAAERQAERVQHAASAAPQSVAETSAPGIGAAGTGLQTAAGTGAGLPTAGGTAATPHAVGAGSDGAAAESALVQTPAEAEVIPLRGLRKAIAEHMLEAVRHAPQVTSMDLFDLTELVKARALLLETASAEDVRLTYLPFFVKAAVFALRAVPAANAVLDEAAGVIRLKREYNIGIATSVPGGLVVPVVKGADRLSLLEIAAEIERLVRAARERRSPPSELAGGTFTITSFGGLAGSPLFATPILNYPEVAILGIGRIDLQPRVVSGQVVARQCAGVSLTFDHRVLDGEGAGQFMAILKRYLEQPLELLLRLR